MLILERGLKPATTFRGEYIQGRMYDQVEC